MTDTATRQDGPGPVLRLQDLHVHYEVRTGQGFGQVPLKAVDGVDLQIRPGECLGLVGESGCGKSSLAQAVMGLVPATSGVIELDGRTDWDRSAATRLARARTVQMVFQDPFSSLNPRQSIATSLGGPLRLHGVTNRSERADRVAEMLRKVGLNPDAARRYPHEFSGGQRQRICIARALIVDPKLVVCDEPVSALDVSIRAQIINLLLQLKDELGVALLMISHDLGVVEHMSDRIAVMYLGRIVEEGAWNAIFSDPAHPYTRTLISAIPDPERADIGHERLRGEAPSALAPPPGCAFHPRCTQAFAPCREGAVPAFTRLAEDHRARCHLLTKDTESR
ncbi:ABC transporter ATP-binding protein [Acidimangrovimonas sediminis]|uniref:ABC transporter ATP-binding protein n=1 Tax=Acidimangrovimonas sediminis TaxID=2056283 RepID=UPI000C80FDC6|nr:oligopeptide/dipeptide ABC transporter ATP-binding protein [Acidimangrovimonas sediminis]